MVVRQIMTLTDEGTDDINIGLGDSMKRMSVTPRRLLRSMFWKEHLSPIRMKRMIRENNDVWRHVWLALQATISSLRFLGKSADYRRRITKDTLPAGYCQSFVMDPTKDVNNLSADVFVFCYLIGRFQMFEQKILVLFGLTEILFYSDYDFDYRQRRSEWVSSNIPVDYYKLVFSWTPSFCQRLTSTQRTRQFQCQSNDFNLVVYMMRLAFQCSLHFTCRLV